MYETAETNKVVVAAVFENLADHLLCKRGEVTTGKVRSVAVENAHVDPRATRLGLPRHIIDQLGLREEGSGFAETCGANRQSRRFSAVWLTINDRYCTIDVFELPDDRPPRVGKVPLLLMDWVVDPRGQRLIGNPAHGGEWMSEMY